MRMLSGFSTRPRHAQKKPARRCEIASWDAGAAGPSKPAPGRHEAIEAQIRDEIAVMQRVMICDLRQDEHLVRLDAPEVRRVIEVRIYTRRIEPFIVQCT